MIEPGIACRGLLAAPEIEQQCGQDGDVGPVVALRARPAHPLDVPGAGQVGIDPDLLAATGDREAAAFGDDDAELALLDLGPQIVRGGAVGGIAQAPDLASARIGIRFRQLREEQPEIGDEVDGSRQIGFGEPTAVKLFGAVGQGTGETPPFGRLRAHVLRQGRA